MVRMPSALITVLLLINALAARAADAPDKQPAAATRPAGEVPPKRDAAKLITAIRNDDLVWEMEFPTENHKNFWWIGPHYSPHGRRDSATRTLIPYPPPFVGQNGLEADNEEEWADPPFRFREIARPLVDTLKDPDRWIAAHVVLSHLVMMGDPEARDLRKAMRWPWPWMIQGTMAWLINVDDRENLKKLPNGAYLETFGGLRVELTPGGPERTFELGGTPGGEWRVQTCTAKVDPAQREPLHKWWLERLDLLAKADAANPPAKGPATKPADE